MWNYITRNASEFTNKVMRFLKYFWGTHDGKYIIDHNGNKILFIDNEYKSKVMKETPWTYKNQ